jgi:hypothetical protein
VARKAPPPPPKSTPGATTSDGVFVLEATRGPSVPEGKSAPDESAPPASWATPSMLQEKLEKHESLRGRLSRAEKNAVRETQRACRSWGLDMCYDFAIACSAELTHRAPDKLKQAFRSSGYIDQALTTPAGGLVIDKVGGFRIRPLDERSPIQPGSLWVYGSMDDHTAVFIKPVVDAETGKLDADQTIMGHALKSGDDRATGTGGFQLATLAQVRDNMVQGHVGPARPELVVHVRVKS